MNKRRGDDSPVVTQSEGGSSEAQIAEGPRGDVDKAVDGDIENDELHSRCVGRTEVGELWSVLLARFILELLCDLSTAVAGAALLGTLNAALSRARFTRVRGTSGGGLLTFA